jgi:hypothetical protein
MSTLASAILHWTTLFSVVAAGAAVNRFLMHCCCVLQNKGCFHGSELAMVFDFTLALWTSQEKALASAFVEYVLHCYLCVICEV